MASVKQDYSSAMSFNDSWLKSKWKSTERIESSKKLSVTKKPSGIRMYNHLKLKENPWNDLFKNFRKQFHRVKKIKVHTVDY